MIVYTMVAIDRDYQYFDEWEWDIHIHIHMPAWLTMVACIM